MMELGGRVGFARLTYAAQLLLVTVVHANDFNGHFTVQCSQFFGLSLRFFVIFRAPLRNARVRFALSICGDLARFFELICRPYQIFLSRAIRDGRRLFYVQLIRQLSDA